MSWPRLSVRALSRPAQVPECYEEPLLRFVHHAIGTADDLESRLLAEFQDRIMPGEELSARAGDKVRPCQLIALENVRAPPLPDGALQISPSSC